MIIGTDCIDLKVA